MNYSILKFNLTYSVKNNFKQLQYFLNQNFVGKTLTKNYLNKKVINFKVLFNIFKCTI